MNKYIDAEKLIAEIEKRRNNALQRQKNLEKIGQETVLNEMIAFELDKILSFITSLQQEQPENWNDKCREDEPQTRFAFYTYEDEDGVLYLSNVFVEEISRNKGFGTKILTAAEKVAETIGATTIRLKVKRNSQANDWYRKNGYGYLTFEGEYDWLEKNLKYLKPKQEQPEVDEDFFFNEVLKVYDDNNKYPPKSEEELIMLKTVARHFYELGFNARKDKLPEIELDKFTEKIKTFQGRYKHPEIVSIKGAMAFMARLFYQYPNVARQWYDNLPKATMDDARKEE